MKTLIRLILPVWAAMAARGNEGPRLDRAALLEAADWSWPALADGSNAWARGDAVGAAVALARHLRTRTVPRWPQDPAAVGRAPGASTSRARAAMRHRMESIGIPWEFGERIDWAFNPTTQPDSKWPRNHEWTWQLNRHAEWTALAQAFYDTGDEAYAQKLAEQIRSWIHDCPVPVERPDNGPSSRWRTIEAGIRAGIVWPNVWSRILASRSFDDDTLLLWLASWVEHAQYLMKFKTGGNWLTMEANGLYHVGALFPEFRKADAWRRTALERLTAELDIQVYPDGVQFELAPGYHWVSLMNFLGPVRLSKRTPFAPPPAHLARLERMFDYFVACMQPDRRMPPFNDSGANDVRRPLAEAAEWFPNRADFRSVASNGRDGVPPPSPFRVLPWAGQVFFRSSWDTNATWLAFDAGPFAYGHQHEDKLNVILSAHGRPLLIEGGNYTYDASQWRRHVLSSRAHNVVLVDGQELNRRKSSKETWVVREAVPLRWGTNETADWAEAAYDEGWGRDARRLARHTRQVVFVKPNLFVAIDRLELPDG